MTNIVLTRSHSTGLLGTRGTDTLEFNVPPGEGYVQCSVGYNGLQSDRKGARAVSWPAGGATGTQQIQVRWWLDGGAVSEGSAAITYSVYIKTAVWGRVIVFEHNDFLGQHRFIDASHQRLGWLGINDQISSIVVLSGHWSFYRDDDHGDPYLHNGQPIVLPPGVYPAVADVGLRNDDISSLQAVAAAANF